MTIWWKVQKRIRTLFYPLRKRASGLSFPLICKLRGVKDPDLQGALAQSRKGDPLQIVHTPTERLIYSVTVYSISLNRVLGYLDKETAKKLVRLFGKNFCRDGRVERVLGGKEFGGKEGNFLGCTVRVFETMKMMQHVDDFSYLHGE